MSRHPRPLPQRIAWFQGSRLSRRDLADAITHEARMLALHVRHVHDTWGIAYGLTLSLSADRRSATVQPGLAYGNRGESLVLPSALTIAVPPASVAGDSFDLLLVPSGGCVALRWSPSAAGCSCADGAVDAVMLGRLVRGPSGVLAAPDLSVRRTVRPLTRPHVASGTTAPGALVWQQSTFDLYAQIDTSAAGFTTTPVYLASIASPEPHTGNIIGPFLSIGQATATHFTVHLMFAAKPPAFIMLFAELDFVKEFAISWTGVESAVGCTGGKSLLLSAGLAPIITSLGATP